MFSSLQFYLSIRTLFFLSILWRLFQDLCVLRLGFGRIPDIRLISNARYPVSGRILKLARYPANYRIVSIFSIRSDIENWRISGQTGYPAQPYLRPYKVQGMDKSFKLTWKCHKDVFDNKHPDCAPDSYQYFKIISFTQSNFFSVIAFTNY